MYSLATLSAAREQLDIREGNTKYDARLKTLLLVITEQIEAACRRKFTRRQVNQFYDSVANTSAFYDISGTSESGILATTTARRLKLSGLNVDADSIELRYDPSGRFPDSSAVSIDQYEYSAEENCLVIRFPSVAATRALRADYVAGFQPESESGVTDSEWKVLSGLPNSISMAALLQLGIAWNRWQASNVAVTEDQNSKSKATFSPVRGLDPQVISLIAPYCARYSGAS